MQARHWKAISEEIGKKVKPDEDFTFTDALKFNLEDHMEFCVKIGDRANKEYGIRKSLDEMKTAWKGIKFDLKPFPAEDQGELVSWIIASYEEI
jgi:hypothetical protein